MGKIRKNRGKYGQRKPVFGRILRNAHYTQLLLIKY